MGIYDNLNLQRDVEVLEKRIDLTCSQNYMAEMGKHIINLISVNLIFAN